MRITSPYFVSIILSLTFYVYSQETGWRANPETVQQLTQKKPGINYEESSIPTYTLPALLEMNGTTIQTPGDWGRRRTQILELFREHVYGRSPGPPEQLQFNLIEKNPSALDGAATFKRIAIISKQSGRGHRFDLFLFLPNARPEAVPVFLLLFNRPMPSVNSEYREKLEFWPVQDIIARGYGMAALENAALAPDHKDHYREGVMLLFEGADSGPRPGNAWGELAAWGWGASRAMDYFETDERIDTGKIAVIGHSRGGKAALWAGAEDERFALVISNNSGEGGAALSRRKFGETVEQINNVFPYWFAENFKKFNGCEENLPVDQHMLIALMAPRAVYVASADEDLWADPRGEFLSLVHASPVFGLFGDPPIKEEDMPGLDQPVISGRRGYHIRSGRHDLTLYDWMRYADFADRLWGGLIPAGSEEE